MALDGVANANPERSVGAFRTVAEMRRLDASHTEAVFGELFTEVPNERREMIQGYFSSVASAFGT